MAKLLVEKITGDVDLRSFDCGNKSINEKISKAYFNTLLQYAYTYAIKHEDEIVGYYMISFLGIDIESGPENIREYNDNMMDKFYAIHIKYIAVDEKYQHNHIASRVLNGLDRSVKSLCRAWPIRVIYIEALKPLYEWYKKLGFLAFDDTELNNEKSTIRMYKDCLLDSEKIDKYFKEC